MLLIHRVRFVLYTDTLIGCMLFSVILDLVFFGHVVEKGLGCVTATATLMDWLMGCLSSSLTALIALCIILDVTSAKGYAIGHNS